MVKKMHSFLETVFAGISEYTMKPHEVLKSIVSEVDFPRYSWICKIEEDELDVTKVATGVTGRRT